MNHEPDSEQILRIYSEKLPESPPPNFSMQHSLCLGALVDAFILTFKSIYKRGNWSSERLSGLPSTVECMVRLSQVLLS